MELSLTPFVDQLRKAGCRQVEGLLEFAATTVEPRQLPAFFVVPTTESARASSTDQARDQAVDAGVSVMVVLDGTRRAQAGISEELRDQTRIVKDALVGWTHPDAARACAFAGGRLASASGSTVVWEVRLTTRYHLRKKS